MEGWGDYFNQQPRHGIYETNRDAVAVEPARPERARHWTYDLLDLLKQFSGGKQRQGGGPAGPAGGPAMAYIPPTGKGGSVDVVKLAMMIFGGAGGMGGMGGMGGAEAAGASGVEGAGAASSSSGMGNANQAMSMYKQFGGMMGGGSGGGNDVPPSAQPMAMMQLPYMTMAPSESPGPIFGNNVIPSTLDVWRPKQRNSLFPGNPYG